MTRRTRTIGDLKELLKNWPNDWEVYASYDKDGTILHPIMSISNESNDDPEMTYTVPPKTKGVLVLWA